MITHRRIASALPVLFLVASPFFVGAISGGCGPSASRADGGMDGSSDTGASDAPGEAGPGSDLIPGLQPGFFYAAASADGSAMLLVQNDVGLQYSHYEPGSGWSAPATVPGADLYSGGATIGMDDVGNAYVGWFVNVDGGADPLAAVSRYDHKNQSFGQPQLFEENMSTPPALSVNGAGEVILFNGASPTAPSVAPIVHHYAAGVWTTETIPGAAGVTTKDNPFAYLGSNGIGVIAYVGPTVPINIATRASNGTWTPGPSSTSAPGPFPPSLVTNVAGDVAVSILDIPSQSYQAYQYDATSHAWSGPTMVGSKFLPTAPSEISTTLSLAANGDGILLRAYEPPHTGLSVPGVIDVLTYTKSTGVWSAPTVAPTGGWIGTPSSYTNFTQTAANAWLVGYSSISESDAGQINPGPVVYNTYTSGGSWSAQQAWAGTDAFGLLAFGTPTTATWIVWWEQTTNTTHARKVM